MISQIEVQLLQKTLCLQMDTNVDDIPILHTITGFVHTLTNGWHQWSRNRLPFQSTRVHPRFVVGFMLLDLQFYVYVLQIAVCSFVLILLAIVLCVLLRFTDSDYPFGIFKLFLQSYNKKESVFRPPPVQLYTQFYQQDYPESTSPIPLPLPLIHTFVAV